MYIFIIFVNVQPQVHSLRPFHPHHLGQSNLVRLSLYRYFTLRGKLGGKKIIPTDSHWPEPVVLVAKLFARTTPSL